MRTQERKGEERSQQFRPQEKGLGPEILRQGVPPKKFDTIDQKGAQAGMVKKKPLRRKIARRRKKKLERVKVGPPKHTSSGVERQDSGANR